MNSLKYIFDNVISHRSDKWDGYFDVYETYFSKFRNKKPVVVEVGVAGGGSIEMWKHYFGDGATIIGVDVHVTDLNIPGVTIKTGDQEDPNFWDEFNSTIGQIDCFIDDGGHSMNQQIITFQKIWPKISNDGVYICEDTHTSYMDNFGGDVYKEGTFMEFSKKLIDGVNVDFITSQHIHDIMSDVRSVHYYNSMVILVKGHTFLNRLIVNDN
jgi:23S rRNA U2552 (ribose-2'-O)-methylase RlmE/FtsJ